MRRVETQNSVIAESRPNNDWIIENADALFRFALAKFKIYGPGVIFIDRSNVLFPPRYISSEEIKTRNLAHLKNFVDQYNPNSGFVVSLDPSPKKNRTFRVDIQKA